MPSMTLVPLEKVMASRNGSVNPLQFPDEVFDLYSIPAFDSGKPEVVRGAEIGSTKQIVEPNDVLLSKIVPHIRRAWVVGPNTGRRMIASGEWIVFRHETVHPPYLRHAVMSDEFHRAFMGTVSGVGGSLLRARPSYVADIKIPLPSLAEQKRIAAILDKADAIRRRRQEAARLADTLIPSVFYEMFGDPVTNRKGFDSFTIDEIAEVQGGLALSQARSDLEFDAPYLRVANVLRNRLDLSEVKTMGVTAAEVNKTRLCKGDVLVVEGHGNRDEVGRSAIWDGSIPDCLHQNHLIRMRVNARMITPEYLNAFINSDAGRRQLFRYGKTTSGLNTISISNVRSVQALVPPLPLQERFSRAIRALRGATTKRAIVSCAFDDLFKSLVQHAFHGEL